jgi:hypothetical protein
MKKVLLLFSGFVVGIIATILVVFLIYVANQPNDDGLFGLTIFQEKGECITTESEIEVMQVVESNMALAWTGGYLDRILVLLINYDGKSYYDNQKIQIPANKCARQIGIYQYSAKNGMDKTIPAVVIEQNNDVSEFKQSLEELKNTRWSYYASNFVGSNLITVDESIEFGNGNYVFNSQTDKNNSNQEIKTEIGTFKVSGDNVVLTSSDGKEKIGIIVGSSLTIDGRTYR